MLSLLLIGQTLGELRERISNVHDSLGMRMHNHREALERKIKSIEKEVSKALNRAERANNDLIYEKEMRNNHEQDHRAIDKKLTEIRDELRRVVTGYREDFSSGAPPISGFLKDRIENLERTVKAIDAERQNLFDENAAHTKFQVKIKEALEQKVDQSDFDELREDYDLHIAVQHEEGKPEEESES